MGVTSIFSCWRLGYSFKRLALCVFRNSALALSVDGLVGWSSMRGRLVVRAFSVFISCVSASIWPFIVERSDSAESALGIICIVLTLYFKGTSVAGRRSWESS